MIKAYKRLSDLTAAEKLIRKAEQDVEAGTARREYAATQRHTLANMHQLRLARIERQGRL